MAPASRLIVSVVGKAYADVLDRYARGHLLDLGCGNVPCYAMYRSRVDRVTCTDRLESLHGSAHIDFACDLTRELPLASDSFDTVLLTDVLEHVPNPAVVFAEMRRVLRPQGRAIIGVPFMYWLHEEPFDFFRYTEHQLRKFCADNGFVVDSLVAYGGGFAVLCDVLLKLLAGNRASLPLVGPLARVLTPIRPRTRPGTSLPLGYVLVARVPSEERC